MVIKSPRRNLLTKKKGEKHLPSRTQKVIKLSVSKEKPALPEAAQLQRRKWKPHRSQGASRNKTDGNEENIKTLTFAYEPLTNHGNLI